MDQNNQPIEQSPVNNMNSVPTMPENTHKKVGPIIAILVIILILIIAGLYLFASKINEQPIPMDNNTLSDSNTSQQETVNPVNNKSDDLQSIQDDLNSSTAGVDSQNI